ncbi:polysaccharide biosynthesis tyrosine autokinase [Joostella atrarenae]|uniref:non-specific protein-tyrosine kinase n=1 Tax=Joostella atrarenae TaxID=679257 RepID=A0ABS9J776_9FLAO|nr:tyrosine-protein kinase family protein [Joostella atrarenae]MCF8716264.1 polysaccharide biosynthesis tyrosine autokinase [Joostella atrarenae]
MINSHNNIPEEEVEVIDLLKLFKQIINHWKIIIISMLFCTSIGYILSNILPTKYKSTATILIDENSPSSPLDALGELDGFSLLGGLSKNNNLQNEILILGSRSILIKVIDSLNLRYNYYKNHYFINEKVTSETLPFNFKFESRNENYNNSFEIKLNKELKSYTLIKDDTSHIYDLNKEINLKDGNLYVELNSRYNKDSLDFNKFTILIEDKESTISKYQESLQVSNIDGSSILSLSMNSNLKLDSEKIINTLIYYYNKNNLEKKRKVSKNTEKFINSRLRIITEELDSIENNKVIFKSKHKLADISYQSENFIDGITDLKKDKLELLTKIQLINSVLEYLKKGRNTDLLPTNIGIDGDDIPNQINDYNNLVLHREELMLSSTNKNPIVIQLDSRINRLRQNILEGLNSHLNNVKIVLNDLNTQESIYDRNIVDIPSQEKNYRAIERQQNIKEALYIFLLRKREEVAVSKSSLLSMATIIDHAYTLTKPVSVNPLLVILGSSVIGLGLPVFFIIIYTVVFRDKVYTTEDLEQVIPEIPILGELPLETGKTDNYTIIQNERSILAEALRVIRSNLNYLNTKKSISTKILVTSSDKGEGKTFVSINLSLVLASANKKVLLVGIDLRNPQIHNYLKEKISLKDDGISDVLNQSINDVDKIINKKVIHENMDVITSGSIPPNPSELLQNGEIAMFLASVEKKYDYIILDSAPLMLVADSFEIVKHADVTICVVRASYSKLKNIHFIKKIYKQKKIKNPSLILNGVKMNNLEYGYKYGEEKKRFSWKSMFTSPLSK